MPDNLAEISRKIIIVFHVIWLKCLLNAYHGTRKEGKQAAEFAEYGFTTYTSFSWDKVDTGPEITLSQRQKNKHIKILNKWI